MKFLVLCLFSFVAIATASHELSIKGFGLEYVSPNIRLETDGAFGKIQTADRKNFVETVNRSPEIYLGTLFGSVSVRFSSQTKEALAEAIEKLSDEIGFMSADELTDLAVVTPTYVQVKENNTGVEFMVSTDGIAYLSTPSGAGVQLSPDSFQVKETNGKVKAMDISPVKDSVKKLSDALAAEAKYWIELLKDKIEN